MARIGENVDPSLGRADTKGILLGSMEGAAAFGQGLAAAGQDLAQGMKEGRERKVKRKGAETKIDALLKLHEGNENITSVLAPLKHILTSEDVTAKQKDAVVLQLDPMVSAFTAKQAFDFTTAAQGVQEKIVERQTTVAEGQLKVARKRARADMLTARAATRPLGAFNELGFRTGREGTIEYMSEGIKAADIEGVKNLLARKDALSASGTMIQSLEDFRKTVNDFEGNNFMEWLVSSMGDVPASKYAESFNAFRQDFAQRLAKARNGARVTDADVENAKKALFSLAKSKEVNLELIDRFTNEIKDRKAEVDKADEYFKKNFVMIGYTAWAPENEQEAGATQPGATQRGTGDGSALAGMADEERGVQRPLPPGGDDFAEMLRSAKLSAADLEEFKSGNNAQKVALLGKLQKRAGLPAQRTQESPGGKLGTTAKEQVMESVLNPAPAGPPAGPPAPAAPPEDPLLTPEGKTTGEFVDPQTQLDQETLRFLQERASGGASLREGMPAIGHPYLEGRKRSEISQVPMEPVTPAEEEEMLNEVRARRARLGEPQTPTTETSRAAQFEPPGGTLGGDLRAVPVPASRAVPVEETQSDLRASRFEVPGGVQEVSMGDERFLARPINDATGLRLTRIPDEIKASSSILTDRLPRATEESAQQIRHDRSATLRIPPEFSPSLSERTKLRDAGNLLLNLDSNHSGYKSGTKTPKKRVLAPKMIVPDDATPQERTRARMAVELMDEMYDAVHGKLPPSSPSSRVLTRSQNNGRGRKGIMHSELFAVTDDKMVNYLKTEEGGRAYASIFRAAFGDLDKIKYYLPHSQGSPGAKTDKGSSEADLALHFLKFL